MMSEPRVSCHESPRRPMETHILRGLKQEIAEGLARISGEVREAIVFVEDRRSWAFV